jgi:rhodanese-related sulfurtransferase
MIKIMSMIPGFVLLIALLGSAGCAAETPSRSSTASGGVSRVGVDEFARAMQGQDVLVLDVRTPEEFKKGHLPGALNVDVNGEDFAAAVERLDPERTTLVYCRSGRRSARACAMMEQKGFREILDLAPGILGWEAAGQPVVR